MSKYLVQRLKAEDNRYLQNRNIFLNFRLDLHHNIACNY